TRAIDGRGLRPPESASTRGWVRSLQGPRWQRFCAADSVHVRCARPEGSRVVVGAAKQVGKGLLVLRLGGGLELRVRYDALGRHGADAVTRIRLDGLDDGESALLCLGHRGPYDCRAGLR